MTDYTTLTRTELWDLIDSRFMELIELEGRLEIPSFISKKTPRSKADCIGHLSVIENAMKSIKEMHESRQRTKASSNLSESPQKSDVQVTLAQRQARITTANAKTRLFNLLLTASLTKVLACKVAFEVAWHEYRLNEYEGVFGKAQTAWYKLLSSLRHQLTSFEIMYRTEFCHCLSHGFSDSYSEQQRLVLLAEFNKLNQCFEPVRYPSMARLSCTYCFDNHSIREWLESAKDSLSKRFQRSLLETDIVLSNLQKQASLREVIVVRAMALC